jgi:competence protein ComEC
LGIALFSRFFFSKCIRFFPEPIALSLSASLAAQIFTIPLTLAFFGTITPIGIIATVFISPLISLFMSLSITAIILALCLPQTLFFSGVLIQGLYSFIAFLVVLFAKVPAIQF